MKFKKLLILALLLAIGQLAYTQQSRARFIQLAIRFDDAPEETSWTLKLLNEDGTVLREIDNGGPYSNLNAGKTVLIRIESDGLSDEIDRYEFVLKDAGGDGISEGAWAIHTRSSGREELIPDDNLIRQRILNGNSTFSDEISVQFSPADRVDLNSGALGALTINQLSPLIEVGEIPMTGLSNFSSIIKGNGQINLSFTSNATGSINLTIFRLFHGLTTNSVVEIQNGVNTLPFSGEPGHYIAIIKNSNEAGRTLVHRFVL